MSVEFDTACCTAQPEDSLQLYIRNPASQRPRNLAPSPLVTSQNTDLVKSQKYSAVLNKFSGKTNWPSHGVVLPGNEILFSLETASDYVKGEGKDPNYGFKCLVTGYECQDAGEDGLKNLEHELAYLGGLCASSLMSKAIQLPNTTGHETDKKETEPSQSLEASISLDRSPAPTRLEPPAVEVSQSLSAPASPSVTSEKTEEMCQTTPVTSKSNDDLESENARLKEQRTCKICMDKEVGLTL